MSDRRSFFWSVVFWTGLVSTVAVLFTETTEGAVQFILSWMAAGFLYGVYRYVKELAGD